jgi:hypothetical protein
METTHRTPVLTRSSIELAVLVSLVSLTISVALAMFLNVSDSVLILATIAAATVVGFRHAMSRPRPVRRHLELVGHAA